MVLVVPDLLHQRLVLLFEFHGCLMRENVLVYQILAFFSLDGLRLLLFLLFLLFLLLGL